MCDICVMQMLAASGAIALGAVSVASKSRLWGVNLFGKCYPNIPKPDERRGNDEKQSRHVRPDRESVDNGTGSSRGPGIRDSDSI